jgi:predicted ATP-dependent serine protease
LTEKYDNYSIKDNLTEKYDNYSIKDNFLNDDLLNISNYNKIVSNNDSNQISSVSELRKSKFKPLVLSSKYKSLLGRVPDNFRLLLWGAPGHGKSSLALILANDIARKLKTLYVSAEESLNSATLSSRIKRFKANGKNLIFNDSNNIETIDSLIQEQNPKFVVIDSVNVISSKIDSIIQLILKYNNVGFILIAQATKDHKNYSGIGTLAHAVDIVVKIENGSATAQKNRFAGLGTMIVAGLNK